MSLFTVWISFLILGKSTLAALLERFYDVDHGSIKIDGHDLRDLDPTWLRGKLIGFINQVQAVFLKFTFIMYQWTDSVFVQVNDVQLFRTKPSPEQTIT